MAITEVAIMEVVSVDVEEGITEPGTITAAVVAILVVWGHCLALLINILNQQAIIMGNHLTTVTGTTTLADFIMLCKAL